MKRLTSVFILAIFVSVDCKGLTTFGKSYTNANSNPPLKNSIVRNLIIYGVKDILDKVLDSQIIQKIAELVEKIRTASITRDINKVQRSILWSISPINTLVEVQAIEVLQQYLEKIEQGHGLSHNGHRLNETLGDVVKKWSQEKSDSAKQNVVDSVLKTIIEDMKAFISQKKKDIDQLHQQSDKLRNDVKTMMSDETDYELKMTSVKEMAHQQRKVEQKQFGDELMIKMVERVLVDVAGERSYFEGICGHLIYISTCID